MVISAAPRYLAETIKGGLAMRALILFPFCLVAACSGGEEKKAEEAPVTVAAGQWETTTEVTSMHSTDHTAPAVKAAVGDKSTSSACVAAAEGAKPSPALFAGKNYQCRYKNSYIKNGRITASLSCTRTGLVGEIMMSVDGSYTASGLDAKVETTSYLPGTGDFQMNSKLTGRRIAPACAAEEPAPGRSGKSGG